jgi:DNA-binding transcriptional regulator YiaG
MGQIVQLQVEFLEKASARILWLNRPMTDESRRSEFEDSLRQRVKALRQGRGWTTEETARFLGIPAENYRKYESRSVLPMYLAEPLSRLYGVDIHYLLTGRAIKERPADVRPI